MVIKIHEKRPTGKGSFDSVLQSIRKGEQSASDMRGVWPGIIEDLRDAMRFSFSESNPGKWGKLKDPYRNWKIKKGYPATIGIRTGDLKKSFTEDARTKIERLKFSYTYGSGKTVSEYAQHFSNKRPVFNYARAYINKISKQAVEKAIADGFKK